MMSLVKVHSAVVCINQKLIEVINNTVTYNITTKPPKFYNNIMCLHLPGIPNFKFIFLFNKLSPY